MQGLKQSDFALFLKLAMVPPIHSTSTRCGALVGPLGTSSFVGKHPPVADLHRPFKALPRQRQQGPVMGGAEHGSFRRPCAVHDCFGLLLRTTAPHASCSLVKALQGAL